jgi:hypothetical protein
VKLGAQRCARLVSQGNGHDASSVRDRVPGGRRQDEATQSLTTALHEQFDLGTGQTHAIDSPDAPTQEDLSVVPET